MDIIPVPLSDQPNPIPNLRTRTFFIASRLLDNDILKNGLDQLIRQHWRKLSARILLSHESRRLEYQVPETFGAEYALFKWSVETKAHSIHEDEILSKIITPGKQIALLPSMDEVDKLLRPSDWPFERKDEQPDSPLLYVHLTNFSDATIVTTSCPHIVADQSGLANIVKAWIAVVEGKTPPEMVGYREDVMAQEALAGDLSQQEDRRGRMRVRSRWDQTLIVGKIAMDLMKEKEESHIVFLPMQLIQSLRGRTIRALAKKNGTTPNVSNGDIISAIFTKFSRMHDASEYSLALSQTINLRGRIPALAAGKGDGFIHNGLHYATANFRMKPSTPIHEIASHNRAAISQALQESDISAGISTLRELAESGQLMIIADRFQRFYSVSNWSATWRGIDFSEASKQPQEGGGKPEIIVLGQSRTLKAAGRYRACIMCRTNDGFWCDFAAPLKAITMIKDHLAKDSLLESL